MFVIDFASEVQSREVRVRANSSRCAAASSVPSISAERATTAILRQSRPSTPHTLLSFATDRHSERLKLLVCFLFNHLTLCADVVAKFSIIGMRDMFTRLRLNINLSHHPTRGPNSTYNYATSCEARRKWPHRAFQLRARHLSKGSCLRASASCYATACLTIWRDARIRRLG